MSALIHPMISASTESDATRGSIVAISANEDYSNHSSIAAPAPSPLNGNSLNDTATTHSASSDGNSGISVGEFRVANICATFRTHCHLDLRKIAMSGSNVELRRDPVCVRMKLKNPPVTASIWSAGKVMLIGAKSEKEAYIGSRRVARKIQKCGFSVRFMDYKVVNCLSIVYLPFGVRIDKLKDSYSKQIEYEPEIHPAARLTIPGMTGQMQIPQTGNLTITAPDIKSSRALFEASIGMIEKFRKPKEVTNSGDSQWSFSSAKRKSTAATSAAKRRLGGDMNMIDPDTWALEPNVLEDEEDDED